MKYLFFFLAICSEVIGTTFLKYSDGFKNIRATIISGIFYLLSLAFLGITLKYFEAGKAYAIWSGLGTALVVIVGIIYFNESLTTLKIFFLFLILAGVVGLQLTTNHP